MNGGFYRPATLRAPQQARSGAGVGRVAALAGALAVAVLLAAGAGAVLARHPRFAVRRVVLAGVPDVRRAQVEALTDAWIGQPLFALDVAQTLGQLSSQPWVARAAVRKIVPDTIAIEIEQRAPVAVARRGEELWTVDASGAWLARHGAGGPDFVLLDAAGSGDDAHAVARGAAFVERLRVDDPELYERLSEVEVTREGLAAIDGSSGLRLLFGADALEPRRAAARWRVLLALCPELSRHGLLRREADLRFENRIVLKAPAAERVRGKT